MKFLGMVFLTIASVTVILEGCSQFNRSMERSLANDKSYGRGVVEYHRKHPNKRNDGVTVTWSTADYVAMAIAKQKLEGEWVKPTDQLPLSAQPVDATLC